MSVPLAPADLTSLLQALQQAALANGFKVEEFGRIGNWPLLAFTRPLAPIGVPRVYLSAGIHGDEPAPPRTLLRLLHEGFFDGRCSWHICPMLNPVGSHAGKRENGEGIDLNRDYKSQPSHRKWESLGLAGQTLVHRSISRLLNSSPATQRRSGCLGFHG